MSLTALVDSDTPVFSAALSAEESEEWVAFARLDKSIDRIIEASGCTDYRLFVSGKENFRKQIDPLYKANRSGTDPKHREACRLWLIEERGAIECEGYEADDAVGCEQKYDGSTIICGIDKDLLQIPGLHYQWPIMRNGVIVRDGLFHNISHEEGMKKFFIQMWKGDVSDNIVGIYKVGQKRAEKYIEACTSYKQMYNRLADAYKEEDDDLERFHNNLDLLWIWRNYGETFSTRLDIRGQIE